MSQVLMRESDILDCVDFSYSEGNGVFRFCDHSEGESIRLSSSEFVSILADSLVEEDENRTNEYCKQLAANILANSTYSGRAKFLYNLMG